MKLLLLISIAHVFDTVLSQNVITTYDGTIGGNKSITACITGNRDPSSDLEITTSEMIMKEGYPAEEHFIMTEDGYLLTLHRILGPPNATAVFVHHGALSSSFDWVLNGRDKGLAFFLADEGYDVWLANARGSLYSRCHVEFTTDQREYWNFSFHEIALFDLPAAISYIRSMKDDNIFYVGHSMGTTSMFVLSSEKPEVMNSVRATFCMGPVAFTRHLKGLLGLAQPFYRPLLAVFKYLNHGEFLSQSSIWKSVLKISTDLVLPEKIYEYVIFLVFGFDPQQFNTSAIPLTFNHWPAGLSVKTLEHYAQLGGKFRAYDYGIIGNLREYNSTEPPDYDLSTVTKPTFLFWSENDYLANPKDEEHLRSLLPNVILNYKVPFSKFNHMDFPWATNAVGLVYKKIGSLMKNH